MSDVERATAITTWSDVRREHDRYGAPDKRGLVDVIRIFIRTWPYLRPMVVGYWREKTLGRTSLADNNWSFHHAPPLATIVTLLGPTTGLLPAGAEFKLDLLLAATVVMAVLAWAILLLKNRPQVIAAVLLVLLGVGANFAAVMAVDGYGDNLQVGLVSLACLSLWILQYRIVDGRLHIRIRLGTHLVYLYAMVWLFVFLGLIAALFSADVLNQSLLVGEPLTEFVSDFINRPDLAEGTASKPEETGTAAQGTDGAARDALPTQGGGSDRDVRATGPPTSEKKLLSKEQRYELRWYYILFMAVLFVIGLPRILLRYYQVWIMQHINQDLRNALVERWHRLSMRYHSDHRVGDSVYRIYQDSAQVTNVIGTVVSMLQTLIMYVMSLLFIVALDPILGTLVLSIAFFAVAWAHWFSPRIRSRSLVARESNAALTSRIQEVFNGIRVIKAYRTEAFEQQRFEGDSVTAFHAAFRLRLFISIVSIVMFTIAASLLLGAEYLMGIWASMERETFAAVLIALVGLSFVRWNLAAYEWGSKELGGSSLQIQGLLEDWATAQDMAMGLDRVFNILDIQPDVQDAPDARPMAPFRQAIRFEDVSFGYDADNPVLRNVSFSAAPGTITAIVGPTGSGKSTLMSLLPRLFDPDSGRITVDGVDLRELQVDSLRDHVSVALQENVLFGMSVRDNIRYVVPDADDARVMRAAEVACVDDYVASLPNGLDTVLSDRGGKLSTGQRQRLNIARAVAKDAAILILDEPTAALDAATELRLLERLAEWAANRAVFLITHRVSTISRANQILYLEQGRIVERGSHTELMAIPDGRYRRFVDTEARLSQREPSAGEREGVPLADKGSAGEQNDD